MPPEEPVILLAMTLEKSIGKPPVLLEREVHGSAVALDQGVERVSSLHETLELLGGYPCRDLVLRQGTHVIF